MPSIPDTMVNKTAQTIQGWFFAIAAVSGIVSWVMFAEGENGFMAALIAGGCFTIACMIKTKKKYVGGTGVYK